VLGALASAGLVASARGAAGGSRLARPAARVKLDELYRAVGEGELCPLHDRGQSPACPIARGIGPVLTRVLGRAEAAAERELGRMTVADVLTQLDEPARGGRRRGKAPAGKGLSGKRLAGKGLARAAAG